MLSRTNFLVRTVSGQLLDEAFLKMLDRLIKSRHVADLRAISVASVIVYFFYTCLIIFIVLIPQIIKTIYELFEGCATDFSRLLHTFTYDTGALSVCAAVLAWAYLSGNKRLGAVDFFATEILTICRVCIVTSFAERSIEGANFTTSHNHHLGDHSAKTTAQISAMEKHEFTSKEDYTPVFNKSFEDLQPLDIETVQNVTAFYTFRKAVIDLLRKIESLRPESNTVSLAPERRKELEDAHKHMIYSQYLMYEHARLALGGPLEEGKPSGGLIEGEKSKTEAQLAILSLEFVLYLFLRKRYTEGFFHGRLELRYQDYCNLMGRLKSRILKHETFVDWESTRLAFEEANKRFQTMKNEIESIASANA